jgi:prophage regulatory protein
MAMDARKVSRPIQILRLPDVCRATGLCRSTVYQLEAAQGFPARVRISERAVGWVEEEVQGWLAQRILRSRDPSA